MTFLVKQFMCPPYVRESHTDSAKGSENADHGHDQNKMVTKYCL